MNTEKFEHLLEPIEIQGVKIRNRIVMPPMATNFASEDGYVTEKLKAHYEERAKGGVGLVMIEVTCVDSPTGKAIRNQLCCDDDKFIPGLTELARGIHKHGAPVFLQLVHAGRLAARKYSGCQPVAPSAIATPGGDMPRELSPVEIESIVEKFAQAAERAKKAGFDGVEILCTHGYLLHTFFSPLSNFREDAYGGELRNRVRFILDTVHAVKEKVGKDFPVSARITAKEFNIKGGITLEESQQLAHRLEEAGVAILNVSAAYEARRGALHMTLYTEGDEIGRPPMAHPDGFLLPLAEKIKKVVNVPIIGVGCITPEVGEKAIADGQINLAAMGRALLCDPQLPHKIRSATTEDIRPCIRCNECLQRLLVGNGELHCTVNPTLGREKELQIIPAVQKKRVVVIGGGPAGSEAARTAALRGHEVILIEKTASLGGKVPVASVPPFKGQLLKFVNYLAAQVKKLSVRVEIGREANAESVRNYNPDAVIVATGAITQALGLPGIEKMRVFNAEDVLKNNMEVGTSVAVIGGGLVGCEVADFLANKGKKVTIVEMLSPLPLAIESIHTLYLLERLNKRMVAILLGAKAVAVAPAGLIILREEGTKELLACDTIVMATTPKPSQELYQSLRNVVPKIFLIGDCVEPRRIADAVLEGFRVGTEI